MKLLSENHRVRLLKIKTRPREVYVYKKGNYEITKSGHRNMETDVIASREYGNF